MRYTISIVEPVGAHGGNDIYDTNLLTAINACSSFKTNLYTSSVDKKLFNKNIKPYFRGSFGKKNKFIRLFFYLKGTILSLWNAKKVNSKIVHLHFFGFNQLEYINIFLAKKIFGFKVVATIHDVESFEKYAKNDTSKHNYVKFIALMDGIVVHTDYARKELLNNIGNDLILHSRIKTIYACDLDYTTLDDNQIEMKVAREKLNLPQEREIILFFGQIKKVKGLDVLLEALTDVKRKIPSVLLVIAGKVWKDNFIEYERLIEKYSLHNNVELRIGFVDNEDVPYYFNAVDAIVLPYQKIYNSGVLIRAMSFATVTIASDFGPFSEFIESAENGFLFKTGDKSALAKSVIEVLSNKVKSSHIGEKGKITIKDGFSLTEIGKQYCEFYNDILEGEK